ITVFFFSSRRRHTRFSRDWSSDVCSSDLKQLAEAGVVSAADSKAMVDAYRNKLDEGVVTTELVEVKDDEFTIDWSKYLAGKLSRSEERRVGKECRAAWARD